MGGVLLSESGRHSVYFDIKITDETNTKAENFAREHNLPGIGGSDAHSIGEIGNVFVELADFHSSQEFLTALKQAKITGKRSSPFVHFHSTWAKIKKAL